MADRNALFAGRTGDKSKNNTSSLNRRTGSEPEPGRTKPSTTGAAGSSSGDKPRPRSFGKSGIQKGVAATEARRALQVKEAEEHLKHANKMLTKTLTRWNPDFFSAAPLFEKAGACYRAAGEDGKATAMYVQAGECQCHDSVLAHASAARDFREAALITERQGRKDEAAALYLRCAESWVHGDEPGRAAEYLGRSAKLVKDTDQDAAADRFIFASKVMVPDGSDSRSNFTRVVGANEVLVQGITFLASIDRLEESLEIVSRYIIILNAEGMDHSLGRMYLTYCVLALALGDYVRADAAFRDEHLQSTTYLRSEECRVEEELLTAFKDYSPEMLSKAQNDRTLRRLETVIVRIAKSLRVPGDCESESDQEFLPSREGPLRSIGDAQARAQAIKAKYGIGGSSAAVEAATEGPPSQSTVSLPVPPSTARSSASSLPSSSSSSSSSSSPPSVPLSPNRKSTSEKRKKSPLSGAAGEEIRRRPAEAAAAAQTSMSPQASDDPARIALFSGQRKAEAPSYPAPSEAESTVGMRQAPSTAAAAAASSSPGRSSTPVGGFSEEGSVSGLGDAEVDLGLDDLEATLGGGSAGADADEDDLEAMIEAARREAEALGLGKEEGSAEESEEEDIDLT